MALKKRQQDDRVEHTAAAKPTTTMASSVDDEIHLHAGLAVCDLRSPIDDTAPASPCMLTVRALPRNTSNSDTSTRVPVLHLQSPVEYQPSPPDNKLVVDTYDEEVDLTTSLDLLASSTISNNSSISASVFTNHTDSSPTCSTHTVAPHTKASNTFTRSTSTTSTSTIFDNNSLSSADVLEHSPQPHSPSSSESSSPTKYAAWCESYADIIAPIDSDGDSDGDGDGDTAATTATASEPEATLLDCLSDPARVSTATTVRQKFHQIGDMIMVCPPGSNSHKGAHVLIPTLALLTI
jgi:hypothetical protein